MPDPGDPLVPESVSAGSVASRPEFGWFDGMIEAAAPGAGSDALRDAVRRLNAVGLAHMDYSPDGARVKLLFDDATIAGDRFTPERRDALVARLQAVVEALPPGPVFSTLRSTVVLDVGTEETAFAADGRVLRMLTHVRPTTDYDRARNPRASWHTPEARVRRRGVLIAAVALIVGFALTAWRSGWIDRAFSSSPDELALSAGPFGDMLALEVESYWGNYKVTVTRGPAFPLTNDEVEARRAAATTPAERAAVNALASGTTFYIRLLDARGKSLEAEEASLAELLAGTSPKVKAVLSGHITAARIDADLVTGIESRR